MRCVGDAGGCPVRDQLTARPIGRLPVSSKPSGGKRSASHLPESELEAGLEAVKSYSTGRKGWIERLFSDLGRTIALEIRA